MSGAAAAHGMSRVRHWALRCAAWLYQIYYATLRISMVLPDGTVRSAYTAETRGQIFALCERDALALAGVIQKWSFTVLVAQGRDGDWATAILNNIGIAVIRGSTRRGGTRAAIATIKHLQRTTDPIAIVVDGPLGPPGIAKPGVAWCAERSGRPLRPLGVAAAWRIVFPRTWSGMYLPLPFSKVVVAYEGPYSQRTDADSHEARARELTRRLATARERAARVLHHPRSNRTLQAILSSIRSAFLVARDAIAAAVIVPILTPLWLLPWRGACALGRWYGYIAWLAWARGRRVGLINLRRAHGISPSTRDARRAVRTIFGNLGQSIAEGIQFARQCKRSPGAWRELCESEDPDLLHRVLNDPRPRILVLGHLGSWEIAAGLAVLNTQRPGAVVVRRVDNPFLNALWQRLRVVHVGELIEKRGAAREALARLRRGEDVAMLLDENGGYRGIFVPFFGRLASTRKTPAVLSLATGAPVVVGACVRRPGQRFLFRLAMLEPDRSIPHAQAVVDLTSRIVAVYESWIRDAPLQWRWIHWRWKTRPDGREESYSRADVRDAFASAREDRRTERHFVSSATKRTTGIARESRHGDFRGLVEP